MNEMVEFGGLRDCGKIARGLCMSRRDVVRMRKFTVMRRGCASRGK